MKTSLLAQVAVVTWSLGLSATAATLYWDGTDTSSSADGGNGDWIASTASPNWDDAETGGNAAFWTSGSSAVFGGAAGLVTLGSDITVATATFNVSGYEFATAGHSLTISAFAGSGSFKKSGEGTLLVTGQGSYSGNIVVSGGLLQLGTGWNVLGAYNSSVDKVTVASGATLDVAGFWDINFGLTLAGTGTAGQGAFINSGADTGDGHVQTPNIALSADATIGGAGNFYMISPGYATNALVLNGHTLTKIGANTFCMVNTTVSAGNVYIAEGGFGVKISGVGASGVAVTLANTAGATLVLNSSWLDIGSLAGGGASGGDVSLGSGDLYVGALNKATVFAGAISGSGRLIKNGSAALTLTGTSTHSGALLVNSGRLNFSGSSAASLTVGSSGRLAGTGSTTGSLTMNGGTLVLAGGATTQSLTANGVTFGSGTTVWFESEPVDGTVYDVLTYGSGGVSSLGNLTVLARGTLTDDTVNHKLTFTAASSTRTWNTTSGAWDLGVTANWLEGDHVFTNGDRVVFGNISTDAVVSLSGTLKPGSVAVNNAANQYTFAGGAIVGDMGLTKTGDGTLLLNNANSFTGGTRVNGGTLKIGNKDALGVPPWGASASFDEVLVGSGGAVDFNGVVDAVHGYTIAGSGVGGAGALVNTGSAIGNGNAQCSKVRLSADAAFGGTGNWALLTWGYNSTALDLGGHTLTKTGTNVIYLCNTTISTGAVRVAAGTLSQTGTGIVNGTNTTFALDDAADATLALNGIDLAIGALEGGGTNGGVVALGTDNLVGNLTVGALNTSNTFSGAISGWGTLVKAGTNVWVLAGNSGNFNGPVVVNGGTLKLGRSGSSSVPAGNVLGQGYFGLNKVTVNAGATLDLAGFDNTAYGFTLAGSGTEGQGALINSGAATSIGNIQTSFIGLSDDAAVGGAGDFFMIGPSYSPTALTLNSHTLTKTGTNAFILINTTISTGTVYIAQGKVALANAASDGSAATFSLANAAGATLALNNNAFSVNALAGGGSAGGLVALGSGTLTVGALGTSATFGGSIDGVGGVIKVGSGEQTFSGVNTYSGPTMVSNGTLRVNGQHVTGGGYVVAGGATLGGTGTVSVASGTVELQAGATLAPGAAPLAGGTLTLSSLTLASTASLVIDNPSDKVVVTGSLSLDATPVTVSDFSQFSRHAVYPILTCAGSVTGSLKKTIGDTLWIVTRRGDTFYMLVDSGMLITIR